MSTKSSFVASPEHLSSLVSVLEALRVRSRTTRPELTEATGLGRNVVADRLSDLVECGLALHDGLGRSSGGRAPRSVVFRSDVGRILVASFGATSVIVGVADLSGRIVASRRIPHDIAAGPQSGIALVEAVLDELSAVAGGAAPVWGVGVCVPGPVEFASGRPVAPHVLPGWGDFPLRSWFSDRYAAPVWVDNDVNAMALGELRQGIAAGHDDVIFLKLGTGIGAGLISGGRVHRGAQGAAGDVGHVAVPGAIPLACRCGKTGCVEAIAGGWALAAQAAAAAESAQSPWLAARSARDGRLDARALTEGATAGDAVCLRLLSSAGLAVGDTLATLVNFYNPSLIVIGGWVASSSDLLLATVREAVYRRSVPLATRDLIIAPSALGSDVGLVGAAHMVIDNLFSTPVLARWIAAGSPAGLGDLST